MKGEGIDSVYVHENTKQQMERSAVAAPLEGIIIK